MAAQRLPRRELGAAYGALVDPQLAARGGDAAEAERGGDGDVREGACRGGGGGVDRGRLERTRLND